MIGKKIIKRIGAGIMAGLCAFSMLGSSMSGVITADAAKIEFPSRDKIIAQAAQLLGTKYTYGTKGGNPYSTPYTLKTEAQTRAQGIDCSGLVWWTLTNLGYKTSGFGQNNPVPADTFGWLGSTGTKKITYGGITENIEIEKSNLPTPAYTTASKTYEYWEKADRSTITPGSVVLAQNPYGEDHAWIYMGEFNSRSEVVSYLKSIGVPSSKITTATVGDGKGDGGKHWRIESNSSEGVVINNKTDGKKATALKMYAFRVTNSEVTFTITKKDKAGNLVGISKVDGSSAQYGVYTDKACTKKVATITIGSNGKGSATLDEGTYYIKETKAPKGYELDTKVYTTTGGNTTSIETELTGSIKIIKQADDGVLKDHEFKISYTEKGKSKSDTIKTDSKGIAEFTDLNVYDSSTGKAIKYTVSEINVDTRYETPKAQNVYLTNGDKDFTVTTKFENNNKTGNIKINKQAEDGQIGDRTFEVTGNGRTYSAKTEKNGVAEFKELPVYDVNDKPIEYTISEKNVPLRYVVPADQTTTLIADATTEKTFKNESKKGTILINKQAEDGEIGDRTFEVSGNGKTYTAVTNKKGVAEFKELPVYDVNDNPITYTISEKNVPLRYVVPAAQTTTLTADETVKKTFDNNIKKGYISIIKHSDSDENVVENMEAGAEFQVYSKAYNSYDETPEDERDYLITDKNGYDKTIELPYGTYIVHQTKTVNDAEYAADFEVEVTENGKTYEYVINNAPYQAFVKVTKVDAETGKAIALSGAGFEIYRADKTQVVMNVDGKEYSIFYTDNNGIVMTPATLGYGKYTLVEVQAPEGYVLDSKPVAFEITRANSTVENAANVVLLTKKDTPQKGTITVEKSGEIFTGFTAAPQENAPTDGFETGRLSGAKFEITAAEDIITPDGTKRSSKGDVVAVIVTGEDGTATTEPLYLGKYVVTEVEAPYGHILNNKPQLVELTYAGQEIKVNDGATAEFFNHHQRVKIHLKKFMERDELFGVGGNDEFKYVTFGLFTDEEIKTADGKVIPKDYLVSQIALEADMTAAFDKMIPFGKYYVQELSTDEHYVINGEKYPVTYTYAGQEIKTVEIDCGVFENELKRGSVRGKKVDPSDEPLENALFGLFKADETEFTEANALMTATSDDKGNFAFDGIVYGSYVVREIKAPDGYKLSDKKHDVTISKDEQIIEIKAENESIDVDVSKQDVYGKELPGAKMQLTDKDGNVVDEWVSAKKKHTVTKLKAGDYVLKEIAAPTGYVIATEIAFSVDEYGKVTVNGVEATATDDAGNPTIVMVDDTTKASITKTDISGDKEITGAEMKLFDKDGNLVEEWTSTDKAHEITGKLAAGDKYTLHEESAPDGYVVAADIEFTVSETGEIDAIAMKDDTTKVRISKKDITTDDELPGATLQIIDENGNIVEEWVSTSEPYFIEGKLIAGKTYTLREITAPDGYEIANDVKFTVDEKGNVTEVVMYDEHTPTPPPSTPPKTGAERSDSGMACALAALAIGAILLVAVRKKEK